MRVEGGWVEKREGRGAVCLQRACSPACTNIRARAHDRVCVRTDRVTCNCHQHSATTDISTLPSALQLSSHKINNVLHGRKGPSLPSVPQQRFPLDCTVCPIKPSPAVQPSGPSEDNICPRGKTDSKMLLQCECMDSATNKSGRSLKESFFFLSPQWHGLLCTQRW